MVFEKQNRQIFKKKKKKTKGRGTRGMEEEKSSAWQTIVSGNGTRPLGIFPSGTIELVLGILIRQIVKVRGLQ